MTLPLRTLSVSSSPHPCPTLSISANTHPRLLCPSPATVSIPLSILLLVPHTPFHPPQSLLSISVAVSILCPFSFHPVTSSSLSTQSRTNKCGDTRRAISNHYRVRGGHLLCVAPRLMDPVAPAQRGNLLSFARYGVRRGAAAARHAAPPQKVVLTFYIAATHSSAPRRIGAFGAIEIRCNYICEELNERNNVL